MHVLLTASQPISEFIARTGFVPQNERSLKRYERSYVPRNEARCVVSSRVIRRNRSTIGVVRCGCTQRFGKLRALNTLEAALEKIISSRFANRAARDGPA